MVTLSQRRRCIEYTLASSCLQALFKSCCFPDIGNPFEKINMINHELKSVTCACERLFHGVFFYSVSPIHSPLPPLHTHPPLGPPTGSVDVRRNLRLQVGIHSGPLCAGLPGGPHCHPSSHPVFLNLGASSVAVYRCRCTRLSSSVFPPFLAEKNCRPVEFMGLW